MRVVSIPVHPLSLRALQSEYGHGPIVMSNHDPLFTFITCSPLRNRMQRSSDLLSAQVTFAVDDRLALHLQSYDWQVGSALLKLHKMELCKFAASAAMLNYRGGAKAALYVWLQDRGVGEDDYSLETAYKLWQRFGWKIIAGKSTTFLRQISGKAADFLPKKRGRVPKVAKPFQATKMTLSEIEIEIAALRFSKAVTTCFLRPRKKIAVHARIYYYGQYTKMSNRDIAKRLGIHNSCVDYAIITIRRQAEKNVTLHRLLADALPAEARSAKAGLPDTVTPPAPSGYDSTTTRVGAHMRQDTRIAKAPGADRPRRSGVAA